MIKHFLTVCPKLVHMAPTFSFDVCFLFFSQVIHFPDEDKYRFPCPECGKRFTQQTNLKTHMKSHHPHQLHQHQHQRQEEDGEHGENVRQQVSVPGEVEHVE